MEENYEIKKIAGWLKTHALPADNSNDFFKEKIEKDFLFLHDNLFNYFVQHSIVVEPHVRIDDETGTAAEGALFYTENLPPETVLAGLALTSIERTKGKTSRRTAEQVMDAVFKGDEKARGIDASIVQMGGDATTGRGLILVHLFKENGGK